MFPITKKAGTCSEGYTGKSECPHNYIHGTFRSKLYSFLLFISGWPIYTNRLLFDPAAPFSSVFVTLALAAMGRLARTLMSVPTTQLCVRTATASTTRDRSAATAKWASCTPTCPTKWPVSVRAEHPPAIFLGQRLMTTFSAADNIRGLLLCQK